MSSGVSSLPAPADKEAEGTLPVPVSSSPSTSLPSQSASRGLQDFLMSEVDPELSTFPLAAYCFMTGWMCAVLTRLPSFSRDRLVLYRTAMRCPFPPYSFGARSKPATRCRCIVFFLHLSRPQLLTINYFGYYLARPCTCAPLPGFSWAPRQLLPHRGQAGTHLTDYLSFRCLHRPHRRPDRCEDPPMVIPWHVHPGALNNGRRDLALEKWARQPLLVPR